MGQENSQLQPGDLIEVDRPFHQHWALYIGGGYVINLTPVGKKDVQLGVHTVPAFIRRVKKQRLKAVVRKNKWRVNNKYDDSYSPLPVVEIIRRAVGYIGKFMIYRVFGSNCEHFVTMLRYGDPPRTSVGGELQNLDMTENKDCPKPGDLIEIERGPYKQWALYVGDGYVIHVTPLDEGAPSLPASSGSIHSRKAKVKKELLKVLARNDKWHVNNKCDCDRVPFPVEEIIWHAEQWSGRVVPYGLFGSNCDEFVKKLRYGDEVSCQAKTTVQNINAVSSAVMSGLGAGSLFAVASIPVLGLPLAASAPFVVAGAGLLASIGFTSSIIAHSITSAIFKNTGSDLLEKTCC